MGNKSVKVKLSLDKEKNVHLYSRFPIELLRLLDENEAIVWNLSLEQVEFEEIEITQLPVAS